MSEHIWTPEPKANPDDAHCTVEADSYAYSGTGGIGVDYTTPTRGTRSFGVLEMLPQFNGLPWNALALNLVHALRPSRIRAYRRIDGVVTTSHLWGVDVVLEDDARTIAYITQYVEVRCAGTRGGGGAEVMRLIRQEEEVAKAKRMGRDMIRLPCTEDDSDGD